MGAESAIKEAIEDQVTITKIDIELTDDKKDEDEKEDGPVTELLDLSKEQVDRLTAEVFRHFDLLKEERRPMDEVWDLLEAQYDGAMEDNKAMEFNLNTPVTQVKCDSVERLAVKAFLESDPKFDCSLRPESMRQGMDIEKIAKIEQSQSEYLDYELDERIAIDSPLRKVLHQAVLLHGGFMKIPYEFKRKRSTREEFYSGKIIVDPKTGKQRPEGLEAFLQNYPTAMLPHEPGFKYYNQLIQFKDAKFEAKYWETAYDDPKPTFVNCKNFWASKTAEGYDGLCNEKILIERTPYKFWDLKKKERAKEMINVDDMKFGDDSKSDGEIKKNYDIEDLNVLEVTYYFKLNPEDDEETKIVCKFGEDNKVFLGASEYPYHLVDCIYVPFYIMDKISGLYKSGLGQRLTDSHIAQNAILNMMLTETWLELINTPVVRQGSTIADQFLSNRWRPGDPLYIGPDDNIKEELDFLPKPQKNPAAQLINVLMFLARQDDYSSGVSSLASGQETAYDPNAPASKTAMLLRQSGINIEEFINCLLPSFNKVAEIILKLTYQMANSGRKYRPKQRALKVSGSGQFLEIGRDEMILETMIQSRASGFAFDKANEKQENLAIYQIMRADPIVARNPKAVHEMAMALLKSWSPMWKVKADKILLDNEEFNQEMVGVAVQALTTYMQGLQKAAQVTGVAQNPDFKQYLTIAMSLLSQSVNPQPEEKK